MHKTDRSPNFSRRTAITRGVGALAMCGVGAPVLAVTKSEHGAEQREPVTFDWDDPRDNLTAFVKVMGDLNGSPRFWSAQGRIYARRPDHMTIPLVGVEGVRFSKFDKTDDGYLMWTRDWALFRDLETGEVIDTFDNPFTGKTNAVSHILTSRAYNWEMTPDRGQQMPSYTGEAWLIDRPLKMPWVEEGNHVAVTLELLVKYANGVVGSEMEHFLMDRDELYHPAATSVKNARQAWVGNSPWLRWMDMGDIQGGTQWHSTGLKHASIDTLRPEFVREVDKRWPGSLEDPMGYVKPA
ncbi:DUF1838 family protein [Erythrobacter sp. W53]|uniref:DUF1838 family protein n=1 Tax=Erythrobacter sp. W53 TaxID=3425947 RepID=UPI003D767525